jgi:ribosomal protein L11 methyltransferase
MSKPAEYFELIITCAPDADRELLMAELIAAGFEGFTEEGDEMRAFIATELEEASGWKELLAKRGLKWQSNTIADQNWNAAWESSFEPVRVDDFCMVRADFHEPDTDVRYDLVITPKMSFGTGHHATTYQMLQAMRDEDFTGKRVFDFGTGTGVLAILAEKLGATRIKAIDNDEWSINNGLENIERNHCSLIEIELRDTLPEEGQYDIMLANINRNVIVENMPSMAALLAKPAVVLLSGFLEDDLPFIRKALEQNDLKLTGYTKRNGWLCVRALR